MGQGDTETETLGQEDMETERHGDMETVSPADKDMETIKHGVIEAWIQSYAMTLKQHECSDTLRQLMLKRSHGKRYMEAIRYGDSET